jgi:hypothetical protein
MSAIATTSSQSPKPSAAVAQGHNLASRLLLMFEKESALCTNRLVWPRMITSECCLSVAAVYVPSGKFGK